jgi:hypothetical protein
MRKLTHQLQVHLTDYSGTPGVLIIKLILQ